MFGLVADIGGTHARFALVPDIQNATEIVQPHILPAADHASPEDAARAYLDLAGRPADLRCAAIACAGPIVHGAVDFVNITWKTSEAHFAADLGLQKVHLINDLAAAAWAIPALREQDLQWIGDIRPLGDAGAVAVLGVGTGCNAACASSGTVVAGEFGHTGFAPATELEIELWRQVTAKHGRASTERLLSGQGLLHIYHALCVVQGVASKYDAPEQITSNAAREEPMARQAMATFADIMASVAGDVALAFGAFGGLYLTGGLPSIPGLTGRPGDFRARFEAKGRMRELLAKVPVAIITYQTPALLGAMRALRAFYTNSR